jgi:hypothetical protein
MCQRHEHREGHDQDHRGRRDEEPFHAGDAIACRSRALSQRTRSDSAPAICLVVRRMESDSRGNASEHDGGSYVTGAGGLVHRANSRGERPRRVTVDPFGARGGAHARGLRCRGGVSDIGSKKAERVNAQPPRPAVSHVGLRSARQRSVATAALHAKAESSDEDRASIRRMWAVAERDIERPIGSTREPSLRTKPRQRCLRTSAGAGAVSGDRCPEVDAVPPEHIARVGRASCRGPTVHGPGRRDVHG